jgi:hypothetical protein
MEQEMNSCSNLTNKNRIIIMKTQLTKNTRKNRYTCIIMSTMLMLALNVLAAHAQDSGTPPAATQSAPSTSTAPNTSTTTSQTPTATNSSYSHEEVDGLSTNTWILIGIGVIAVLVLGIVIARSSKTKETISRTTIIK